MVAKKTKVYRSNLLSVLLLLLYKKEVNLTADLFMNIYEHAIKSVDIKLCYQVTYF